MAGRQLLQRYLLKSTATQGVQQVLQTQQQQQQQVRKRRSRKLLTPATALL
jgi:hypothetical protein